ncbi:DNA polymerase alpha subunit B [Ceratocystis platani]|uniref:DNA polymerase alpha subunit B n=1 Tax=Ceratocystis fimbriata f. sp. platani TaxID=88771 RepID=A0A0F8BPK3_CERFI|nr:DNA polymerase alpha subunit B [Ceratocystis platani]
MTSPASNWQPAGQVPFQDGEMTVKVQQMGLKVHYTFDKLEQSRCLARLPQLIQVQTLYLDEKTTVGVVDLSLCLGAVAQGSPELINACTNPNSTIDYAVYVHDYSEPDAPLVGHGMLSGLVKSQDANGTDNLAMVTGLVTRNMLAMFGKGVSHTLEVKMKFSESQKVPLITLRQTATMAASSEIQPSIENTLTSTGNAEWAMLVQSNPQLTAQLPHNLLPLAIYKMFLALLRRYPLAIIFALEFQAHFVARLPSTKNSPIVSYQSCNMKMHGHQTNSLQAPPLLFQKPRVEAHDSDATPVQQQLHPQIPNGQLLSQPSLEKDIQVQSNTHVQPLVETSQSDHTNATTMPDLNFDLTTDINMFSVADESLLALGDAISFDKALADIHAQQSQTPLTDIMEPLPVTQPTDIPKEQQVQQPAVTPNADNIQQPLTKTSASRRPSKRKAPSPSTSTPHPTSFSEAPCPPSDVATLLLPLAATTSPPTARFNKNYVKKQAIKERLEQAIQNGEMPPFCNNCGAIETPTWRKVFVRECTGTPVYHEYSDKPGRVTAIEVTSRDDDQNPTGYRLMKKALGPEDDKTQWRDNLLCNPCGIWLCKNNKHRPKDRWEKDAERLGQERRRRGTGRAPVRKRKTASASFAMNNMSNYPVPTSESNIMTDPLAPNDNLSPIQEAQVASRTVTANNTTMGISSIDATPSRTPRSSAISGLRVAESPSLRRSPRINRISRESGRKVLSIGGKHVEASMNDIDAALAEFSRSINDDVSSRQQNGDGSTTTLESLTNQWSPNKDWNSIFDVDMLHTIAADLATFFPNAERLEPDIITELSSIMRLHELSVEDLFYKWESFCIKMECESANISLESVRSFKRDVQDALERSMRMQTSVAVTGSARRNVQSGGSAMGTPRAPVRTGDVFGMLEGLIQTPGSNKLSKTGGMAKRAFETPTVARIKSENQDGQDSPNSRSPNGTSTPSKFSDRQKSGDVLEVFGNASLPDPEYPIVPFPEARVKLAAGSDQKKVGYKPLAMKLSEVSEILDDRIDDFIEIISQNHGLDLSVFGNPASQGTSEIVAVGRIANDSAEGRLNAASVVLETSRRMGNGLRVPLNLKKLRGYSFFPGQIIAARGTNTSGNEFVVNHVLEIPSLPNAASTPEALEAHRQRLRGDPDAMDADDDPLPLNSMIASGPYTTDDSLAFEPLAELCKVAGDKMVDALILMGPFIDIDHPMIASGDFDLPEEASYDPDTATLSTAFKFMISPHLARLSNINPQITIVLIPSIRDAYQ